MVRPGDADAWSERMSATSQKHDASSLPWPGTSCMSSPCANRAGTLHKLQALGAAVQRTPAQLRIDPAAQDNPVAEAPQHAVPRGQPSAPLGCILLKSHSASPAFHHDKCKEPPASAGPSAEKENTPSPDRMYKPTHTAPAPAEVSVSMGAAVDMDRDLIQHREAALQQPLQQASTLQKDSTMHDAGPPVTSHVAQGSQVAHLAFGTSAHHSLQIPASSMQYQHLKPRPASAQVGLSITALIRCRI